MLYVFIDESGDLGFTEKSTKYYVVASVETINDQQIAQEFKKVRKKLKKRERDIPEFKFTKTNKRTKMKILSKLVELDISFSAIVLDKDTFYPISAQNSKSCTTILLVHCRSTPIISPAKNQISN
ncbi:hypothetical protein DRP04_10845 [Archaeoglobales archaeon]|nr:MAG: hypothetical protein DRP04_10845 [Archaeoglobales archaeon]